MCVKCALNDVVLAVSPLGGTYIEDEHTQGSQGGHDPATYQWVGICFLYIYLYTRFLPEIKRKWKVCWNKIWNMFWLPCIEFHEYYELLYDAYMWNGAVDVQVSIRWVLLLYDDVEICWAHNLHHGISAYIIHRIARSPWIQVDASRTDHRRWFRQASRTDL